jgi:hypothetical protein
MIPDAFFTPLRDGTLFDMTSHFYPSRSYGSCAEKLVLADNTSHFFGYVLSGEATLKARESMQSIELNERMYFSLPGPIEILPRGRVIVFQRFGYRGLPTIGGPIEAMGRLSYIDQCTASLIVPPARMTDPCLNQLVFPPGVHQSQHTHPTIRLGLVYEGHGICHLQNGQKQELSVGTAFCLPAHQPHCFESKDKTLGVIAFHPDTDTGPTDESHPMLNRTYISK